MTAIVASSAGTHVNCTSPFPTTCKEVKGYGICVHTEGAVSELGSATIAPEDAAIMG